MAIHWSYCQPARSTINHAASSSIQFSQRMLDRLVHADRALNTIRLLP